mgnify:CR=1 FL=1|tara:strand:+ start:59 stop:397 length:339 start_codon:yes stop_codon:yes gene_type:complete
MSERITLSYSINLNDLGAETHRLYDSVCAKIDALVLPDIDVDYVLEPKVCENIDILRQKMLDIDLCLGDLSSIIMAYNQHRNIPSSPSHTDESFEDDLDEKLKDFANKTSSS